LNHPWFKEFEEADYCTPFKKTTIKFIENVKNFGFTSEMQEVVLRLILQRCVSQINNKDIKKAFLMLDENNNGDLSLEGL
jgi:hypothetical protein